MTERILKYGASRIPFRVNRDHLNRVKKNDNATPFQHKILLVIDSSYDSERDGFIIGCCIVAGHPVRCNRLFQLPIELPCKVRRDVRNHPEVRCAAHSD